MKQTIKDQLPLSPMSPLQLACQDRYEDINFKKLKEGDILEANHDGQTLLHLAAADGQWALIPKQFQDKKYWKTDMLGNSIYMAGLLNSKKTSWIDKEKLTEGDILQKNSLGQSIALHAAMNVYFNQLPKSAITTEVLTQKSEQDDRIIHIIAKSEQFSCIPKEIITRELLSLPGNYGESVYHILSGQKQLSLIPQKLLLKSELLKQSKTGITPLHRIAAHRPELMPKNVTLKDLLLKTKGGYTILHSWANNPNWVNIPNNFLTKQSLEIKDDRNMCPLDCLIDHYKNGWASREKNLAIAMRFKIKYVLTKISKGKLEVLAKDQSPAVTQLVKEEVLRRKIIGKTQKSNAIDI